MRKKFKVESSKLKVYKRYVIYSFCLYFSLFTFHFQLLLRMSINSRAAVVMDASTGTILYAKNPDLRCASGKHDKIDDRNRGDRAC